MLSFLGHPTQQRPGLRGGIARIRAVPPRATAALHPRPQMRPRPGGYEARARHEAPRTPG
jgi:hypothetical protein